MEEVENLLGGMRGVSCRDPAGSGKVLNLGRKDRIDGIETLAFMGIQTVI
jgi:hypothetical protein